MHPRRRHLHHHCRSFAMHDTPPRICIPASSHHDLATNHPARIARACERLLRGMPCNVCINSYTLHCVRVCVHACPLERTRARIVGIIN